MTDKNILTFEEFRENFNEELTITENDQPLLKVNMYRDGDLELTHLRDYNYSTSFINLLRLYRTYLLMVGNPEKTKSPSNNPFADQILDAILD